MSTQTRSTQRQLLAYAALKARRYSQANMYFVAFALSPATHVDFPVSNCRFDSNSPAACAEQFSVEAE